MKTGTIRFMLIVVALALTSSVQAQVNVEITVSVDMTKPINDGVFDPATDFVTVAGDPFNGWNNKADTLSAGSDNIYSKTVQVDAVTAPTTGVYKFVQLRPNGDGTTEEVWEQDPNREVSITGTEPDADSNGYLDVTTTVDFFDRVPADAATASYQAEFRVNMAVAIAQGKFDPDEDFVTVAGGDVNGWSNSADTLISDFLEPDVYFKIIEMSNVPVPAASEFKFVLHDVEAGADPVIGWEGIPGNRSIQLTGDEGTPNSEGFIEITVPEVYWENVSFDDVFSAETTVFLEVDARPAQYFLADSTFLPPDAQTSEPVTSFTSVFANGPFVSPIGWETWGPTELGANPDFQMHDDGTNGDLVAGDGVFTMTIVKPAGAAKSGVVKFSVDGYDNEAPAGADRVVEVDEANPRVSLIFGAILQADGLIGDDNAIAGYSYDAYILVDNSTTPPTATVVRSGGEADGQATDVEDGTLPESMVLSQNYPNPFNPVTTIEYELANSGRVTLQVFDLLGRNVATLVDGVVPAARHSVQFDARNLASGTYIYRLVANNTVVTKTMVLLK